jgi:glycosyltransferase involved in cell wall biosynthesis
MYVKAQSFVEDDWALLNDHFDVRVFRFELEKTDSALGLAELWIRQLWWLLRELPRADLVYGWFADHHMLLPVALARWFGVPTAVVLGGMDCNWLPELDYGVWESRWRAPIVRWVVKHADLLPTVSASLIEAEECYSQWPTSRRNGIRVHVPDLETPHPVINLGFDPSDWPMGPTSRPRTVTTVAYIHSRRTYRVKGIDLLMAAARRLPETRVQVVGVAESFADTLRASQDIPENVHLLPPRPRSELTEVYQETSVYAQLSRVEAFCLVVGEAMLSGCVPVVSPVGHLPTLVGDAGHVLDRPEPDHIASVLTTALDAEPDARRVARDQIVSEFPEARRRRELIPILEALAEQGADGTTGASTVS